MSEQTLDLRRSIQIVRRHKIILSVAVLLGLLAGAGLTVLKPPMLTSQALVVLPPSVHETATQVVIAGSDPVLAGALPHVAPGMSLQTLRSRVKVESLSYNVLAISAQGKTAAQAEHTANAVSDSYVAYVSSASGLGGRVQARVLEPAINAAGVSLPVHMAVTAGAGAVLGLLVGGIFALAIGRSDRRLRERDDIADSIGVPVLASISVSQPSSAADWTKLLKDYKAGPVDEWRLRKALHHLGLADIRGGASVSLAVLSLSSDRKALTLGPQLAAFAASVGIPTALIIGPQQDANVTALLRAACKAPESSRRSRNLWVAVSDHHNVGRLSNVALAIVVAVVDGQSPKVAETMRTTATLLGVSAGAATAEQLARVAANAAADGRQIEGILVADPDPVDHTTGRLPQVTRPVRQKSPTRITGRHSETRR